jgi:hypothetical protein
MRLAIVRSKSSFEFRFEYLVSEKVDVRLNEIALRQRACGVDRAPVGGRYERDGSPVPTARVVVIYTPSHIRQFIDPPLVYCLGNAKRHSFR